MATITRAYYNESGSINVEFEGQPAGMFISVPPDPMNKDYADLMKWEEAGGIIEPYVPLEAEEAEPTVEERLAALEAKLGAS
jgi:hypothetical protein